MTTIFNGVGWKPAPSSSKPSAVDGIRRSCQGSNGLVQETHNYAHADLRRKQVTCWNHDRNLGYASGCCCQKRGSPGICRAVPPTFTPDFAKGSYDFSQYCRC